MQQSTVSFRSNRYSTSNESRRQYLSNQVTAPQNHSSNHSHNHNSAAYPSLIQQQQIQGLQQKVDMILIHNNQLIEQNLQLKKRIQVLSLREVDARFTLNGQSQEIYRLNRELELKNFQISQLKRDIFQEKGDLTRQFDQLNIVLKELRSNYQKQSLQKQDLQRRLARYTQQQDREIARIKQQFENEIYENSLKKQIEHKDELREKQSELNRILEKKMKQWEQQRIQMEEKKMNAIVSLEENMEKEKQEIRKRVEEEFKQMCRKIQAQANERCRKVREQSEAYIKTMLQQYKQEQKPDKQLKNQIEGLKISLQNRQKIIQNLLKQSTSTHQPSYYSQVQQLRSRIKQLTQQFFKQSQLLKVKLAIQHDIDIREMVKVYDNKIEVLTSINVMLQNDKDNIRGKYEDQIRSKMKLRQKFQIQVSKLKNYIRKMKIQLESYGKEMRLNIEGIKDQANSFSMSILGELGQEKNKKNFYEEEIRKMRQVVDLKEHEMDVLTKQSEQKMKYYDDKLKNMKQKITELSEQLEHKDEKFRQQFDAYKQSAKEQMRREKTFWEQQSRDLKKQIVDLRKLTQKLQDSIKQTQIARSDLQKDLQKALHQIQSHKSHIDALKLQLQMTGQSQSQAHTTSLKQHYQRLIATLQHDKQILKQANIAQQKQISKLITKYKVLEKSMQKTLSTLKKKSQLEGRVMELGMDQNLVKNLGEVFRKVQRTEIRESREDRVSQSQRKDKENYV